MKDVVISKEEISNTVRSALFRLLLAAKEKFINNKSRKLDTQNKYEINKRLAILLRRDDFRLKITYDFLVQIKFGDNKLSARLLNISSTGAAIEFFDVDQLPEHHHETTLQLLLPEHTKPLTLLARVVWSKKIIMGITSPTVTMGLQFKNIDEKTRSCLWDFIVNAETSTHP